SDRFATAGDLAAALAALPPMADWPDEQARAWWVRFHATQQHAQHVSSERTVTLAVDLTRAE
ncbi:MAG: hypothetical protein NT062_24710, partial [Proteobacteria bacterium]|nr:hypothetical protein [Pseudomonadota bacterium]